MDTRWTPLAEDAPRATSLALYARDVIPAAIVQGLVTPVRDLTPFVTRMRQSESDLSVTLSWHDELYGPNMPEPGQWLVASLNGTLLCIMLLEAINDYRQRSGERSMTLVARARDATSAWRDDLIATERYPQGTPLTVIAEEVAVALGMDGAEVNFPADAYGTPQAWFQASQVTAWELVEQCLLVLGLSPLMDALGRLRAYSRDVLRAADVTVAEDRVIGFSGSKALPPIDRLLLKWRAPLPVKVSQPEEVLGTTSVTAGYWKRSTTREIYWSEDRTQQADLDPLLMAGGAGTENSRLFVKNDINNGLVGMLDVGNQYFDPIFAEGGGCIGGRISVDMIHHRDDIMTSLIGMKVLAAAWPDGVNVFAGKTISIGRLAEAAAIDVPLFTLLARMGTGVYEVRGRPYDLVNPVNETVAYDPEGSPSGRTETLETDLVDAEARASAIATREFVFRARSASSFTLTIVDDPRIEVGDIVEMLADGTRILVTGVQRDLSPGSSNVVELSGFPA